MTSLVVPTVPNSPLSKIDDYCQCGSIRLRYNERLDFLENFDFDQSLAIYDANYQNSQAYSSCFYQYMKSVLDLLRNNFPKNSDIVEVGCGKGDFVNLLQDDGYFNVRGYDMTYEGENPVIEKKFLTADDRIHADLVVLRHVLEHIKNPYQFLLMLKTVFGDAKIYIEVPSLDWIRINQAFFDVTYEHVNYFSEKTLRAFFAEDVISADVCFGGQYQYIIADLSKLSASFLKDYAGGYWSFVAMDELFPSLSDSIKNIEEKITKDNKFYIWGAATKGCMFLLHCAKSRIFNKIAFAVDENPGKCGKYLPGSLVKIEPKSQFFRMAKAGDVLIISNPNYRPEIVAQLESNGLAAVEVICL